MTKISETSLNEASRKEYIKNFSKRMLKTQLFIGVFQEKRFVEPLGSYRDVVKIDAEEKEFIENVMAVRNKVKKEYTKNPIWVGITEPDTVGAPVGYNLWVELPTEVFGKYWFKVRTVEILENEVRVKLDIVRPLTHKNSTSDDSEVDQNRTFDLRNAVHNISNQIETKFWNFWRSYVTFDNLQESAIFIALLVSTIIAGGTSVVQYLMEYLLKLVKELTDLIKACTPIIIAFINVVGKLVYGLLTLIWMLFYGKPRYPPPVYNSYYNIDPNMITYTNPGRRNNEYFANAKGLPYRSSVRITPLSQN